MAQCPLVIAPYSLNLTTFQILFCQPGIVLGRVLQKLSLFLIQLPRPLRNCLNQIAPQSEVTLKPEIVDGKIAVEIETRSTGTGDSTGSAMIGRSEDFPDIPGVAEIRSLDLPEKRGVVIFLTNIETER